MPNVIAMHRVENMDTWLAADNREKLFPQFCSGYRLFRMPNENRVALYIENADVEKMQALFQSPEAAAAKKADTVIDPIEIFVEIEGGR